MKKYRKIYIEITNICNKKCTFCAPDTRIKKYMSVSEFDLLTDKILGLCEQLHLHVLGEPLTHPHLRQIVDIANKKGFNIYITTNGTLLHKNEFLYSSVKKITISKTDDESFNLAKTDLPNNVQVRQWYDEFKFTWPSLDLPVIECANNCLGLRSQFAVLVDGTVVPCCLDYSGIINLGNIFDGDIQQILNSDKAKKIREGFSKGIAAEELCKRCGFYALRKAASRGRHC